MNINEEYQEVISKCQFKAKEDTWFIKDSFPLNMDKCSYSKYEDGHKFKVGWSLFCGWTNETFPGFNGTLPREDEETCSFDEFFIYDEYGNEISELTLNEYKEKYDKKYS